jgi:hypothetical protein
VSLVGLGPLEERMLVLILRLNWIRSVLSQLFRRIHLKIAYVEHVLIIRKKKSVYFYLR